MPENYIALFDAPEQEEAQKIIAAAKPMLESGSDCIRDGQGFPSPNVRSVEIGMLKIKLLG